MQQIDKFLRAFYGYPWIPSGSIRAEVFVRVRVSSDSITGRRFWFGYGFHRIPEPHHCIFVMVWSTLDDSDFKKGNEKKWSILSGNLFKI
jgi:hypothetical protein